MYKPFDLTGHASIITGGNGGIGLGMARALLASGARVAIWGSNPEKTRKARELLASECGDASRVHSFVCDVGEESQIEEAFAASVQALGGTVHSCFANAGVSGKGVMMSDMSLDEFRRIQRINVEGVF
ncbi:MAG: SDR family NAD(P)-dependent oxidoreductase, partial [Burkholderiales bacterium]